MGISLKWIEARNEQYSIGYAIGIAEGIAKSFAENDETKNEADEELIQAIVQVNKELIGRLTGILIGRDAGSRIPETYFTHLVSWLMEQKRYGEIIDAAQKDLTRWQLFYECGILLSPPDPQWERSGNLSRFEL